MSGKRRWQVNCNTGQDREEVKENRQYGKSVTEVIDKTGQQAYE